MSSSRHEKEQLMLFDMKGGTVTNAHDWREFTALRRLRDVRRLAGFHLTRPYSDAEHCYYTGLLFLEIAKVENVPVSASAIEWVFTHDAMEAITGDLLYPVKHASDKAAEAWDVIETEASKKTQLFSSRTDAHAKSVMTDAEWRLFKDCDALELWLFCIEEKALGNILANVDGTTVEDTMYAVLVPSPFATVRKAIRCK